MELDARAYQSTHFKQLAGVGQIHVDTRDPPSSPQRKIDRRQHDPATSSGVILSTTQPSSTLTPTADLSHVNSSNPTTTTNTTTPALTVEVVTTPLPSPFDTSLGSNFTSQSCPDFFRTFLSNSTFKSCIPASLLLQNSNSFFRAERDPSLLAETLDAACNAPVDLCTPVLRQIATDLISSSNCGADYKAQNPLVTQAYNGLLAYEPLYHATCLKDPNTGSYCFADAIASSSSPSDAYPYYTALGLQLPAGSRPTCSQCLKHTMDILASFAVDPTQPLASTYTTCAQMVDRGCGSDFANRSVRTVAATSGAGRGLSIFSNKVVCVLAALTGLLELVDLI